MSGNGPRYWFIHIDIVRDVKFASGFSEIWDDRELFVSRVRNKGDIHHKVSVWEFSVAFLVSRNNYPFCYLFWTFVFSPGLNGLFISLIFLFSVVKLIFDQLLPCILYAVLVIPADVHKMMKKRIFRCIVLFFAIPATYY